MLRPAPMRPALIALAALTLAACARDEAPAPVVYRNQAPAARAPVAPTASAPLPAPVPVSTDAAGVVDYGGYSAVITRQGDTVETVAARVGISGSELASYNGLPSGYQPRAGDELILPPRPGGYATAQATPLPPTGAETATVAAATTGAASGGFTAAAGGGATANSTGFDLDRIEASLEEPAAQAAPRPAPLSTAPATPPSNAAPSSPRPAPAAAAAPAPQVAAAQPAPAAAAPRFTAPVDGSISRAYSAGGDGVDYAAPAGSPVRAASDGQVALVSESLGGYGTIVLIRHRDSLLTLYGRIDQVSVAKGDRVRQGQQIGVVAPGGDNGDSLHFEVREGVDSVDPARYLAG